MRLWAQGSGNRSLLRLRSLRNPVRMPSTRPRGPPSPPPAAAIDVVGAQSGKSIGSMLQQALLILR